MTLTGNQNPFDFPSAPNSPASHLERKMKKPLMEKRRRARINQCLAELKSLLLDSVPTVSAAGNSHPTKLEKADILEMTVRHLKARKTQQNSSDLLLARQTFADGYSTCFQAVLEFLGTSTVPIDPRLRFGLMAHISRLQADPKRPGNIPAPLDLTAAAGLNSLPRRQDLSIAIPHQRGMRAAQLPTPPFRRHLGSTGSDLTSETSGTLSPTSSVGSFSPATPSSAASTAAVPWRPW